MYSTSRAIAPVSAALRSARIARVAQTAARSYATPAVHVVSTRDNSSSPLLGNIEASWKNLDAAEQYQVYQKLGELQKKDWNQLSIDEKKAAYWVAFGPHGPRAPIHPPNYGVKVFAGTVAVVGGIFAIFTYIRSQSPPLPGTFSREYQEATNEYMKEQKINPITGVASEDYKGKGMIQ